MNIKTETRKLNSEEQYTPHYNGAVKIYHIWSYGRELGRAEEDCSEDRSKRAPDILQFTIPFETCREQRIDAPVEK